VSGPPSLLRYCCNFFSSFCCLLRRITASGLEMDRVKLVSGSSVYNFSATFAFWSLFCCCWTWSRFLLFFPDGFLLKELSSKLGATDTSLRRRRRKRPSRSSLCQFSCTISGRCSASSLFSMPFSCISYKANSGTWKNIFRSNLVHADSTNFLTGVHVTFKWISTKCLLSWECKNITKLMQMGKGTRKVWSRKQNFDS